jgi:hypothetical protein
MTVELAGHTAEIMSDAERESLMCVIQSTHYAFVCENYFDSEVSERDEPLFRAMLCLLLVSVDFVFSRILREQRDGESIVDNFLKQDRLLVCDWLMALIVNEECSLDDDKLDFYFEKFLFSKFTTLDQVKGEAEKYFSNDACNDPVE